MNVRRFGPLLLCFLCAGLPARASDFDDINSIEKEVEAMKSPHPWAGYYSGFSEGIYLAPSGRYCVVRYSCLGSSGNCGKLRPNAVGFVSETQRAWERNSSEGPPYRRVSWGKRRYLVSERAMLKFVNAINETVEPRYDTSGVSAGYLYRQDHEILVTGHPDLPAEYRRLLLGGPLVATAVWVGSRTHTIERVERYENEKCETPVRFDVGAASGVFVGMELSAQTGDHMADAVITEVSSLSSKGIIDQFDCDKDEPFVSGGIFASRPSYRMNVVLSMEPLRTEVRYSTAERFDPFFNGDPEELWLDDPLKGAVEAGFSAVEIADISFVGPFNGALHREDVVQRIRRTILSLGGNAVIKPWGTPVETGTYPGVAEVRRMKILRLSYRNRPIEPGGPFRLPSTKGTPRSPLRHDWGSAVTAARAAQCGLALARRNAEKRAALDLLGWDEGMLRRAHDIRFEDLDTPRRQAAEGLVPERRRQGYVWPALFAKESEFTRRLRETEWEAESEFKKAFPEEAAECERLEKAADLAYYKH